MTLEEASTIELTEELAKRCKGLICAFVPNSNHELKMPFKTFACGPTVVAAGLMNLLEMSVTEMISQSLFEDEESNDDDNEYEASPFPGQ